MHRYRLFLSQSKEYVMRNVFKQVGVIALVAIIGFSMVSCDTDKDKGKDEDEMQFTSETSEITNDTAALGIIGTSVQSSNEEVAVAEIKDGKIVVTSKGKGIATITVIGPADKSDAEIKINVDKAGKITQGSVLKGGESVITISGTFGGASVAGESYPVNIVVRFDWDSTSVYMEEAGEWSIKHLPFESDVTLWFDIRILTDGTSEDITKYIGYQPSYGNKIRNQSITNISIPKIDIPGVITLSGTAKTTLTGTWNRTEEHTGVSVSVVNKSITTDIDVPTFQEGWTGAETRVAANGNWELSIPSSTNETDINFNVIMSGTQLPKGLWEAGQKTGLNPIKVTNQDKSGINLGTIPFVMVSGNTPVTVNGKRPYEYWIEFGYYWDEDESVVINGWSGSTRIFSEGMGSAWSVPMPANTKLKPEIYYREKSSIQFRKSKVSESSFTTSTQPYTLDLRSISNITN
jgi:hypothetical protein